MNQKKHPILFVTLLAACILISGLFLSDSFLVNHHVAADGLQYCPGLAKEQNNSIDVLVTGDSESYTSFSPLEFWKEYGATSYVAGKSGGTISEVKDILNEAFLHQSPKVVLLETNTLFRKKACKGTMKEAALADSFYEFLPFLKYHNIWKNLFIKSTPQAYKGFDTNSTVVPYTGKIEGTVETDNVIHDDTKEYLKQILAMCQENHAVLVLYSAPSPKNYNVEKVNQLKQLAEKMNLDYINLNEEEEVMNINWDTDTRDAGDHLNASGGVKTTVYLGKYLKSHFDLPDRSHTAIASSWNNALTTYDIAMNKTVQPKA